MLPRIFAFQLATWVRNQILLFLCQVQIYSNLSAVLTTLETPAAGIDNTFIGILTVNSNNIVVTEINTLVYWPSTINCCIVNFKEFSNK